MKIGIDVDGVLFDAERAYRTSAEILTLDVFGAKEDKLINKSEMAVDVRMGWTPEETDVWMKDCLIKDAKNANFMPGAIEVINRLKNMGHKLYIITARGGDFLEMENITLDKLKEVNLEFDGYFFASGDKGKICQENGIEILIDDGLNNCKSACENGIKSLYFRDVNIAKFEHELCKEVNNWGEIYKYFKLNVE